MFHPKIEEQDVVVAGAGHNEITMAVDDEAAFRKVLATQGLTLELVQTVVNTLRVLRQQDVQNQQTTREQVFVAGVLDGFVMGLRTDRAARARVLGMDMEPEEVDPDVD